MACECRAEFFASVGVRKLGGPVGYHVLSLGPQPRVMWVRAVGAGGRGGGGAIRCMHKNVQSRPNLYKPENACYVFRKKARLSVDLTGPPTGRARRTRKKAPSSCCRRRAPRRRPRHRPRPRYSRCSRPARSTPTSWRAHVQGSARFSEPDVPASTSAPGAAAPAEEPALGLLVAAKSRTRSGPAARLRL